MKEKDIIDAYLKIRKIDNTIADEVLDFMKKAAIERLNGMGDGVKLQEELEKLFDDNENYISGYTGTPVIMSERIIPKIVAMFNNQFPPESSANAMQGDKLSPEEREAVTKIVDYVRENQIPINLGEGNAMQGEGEIKKAFVAGALTDLFNTWNIPKEQYAKEKADEYVKLQAPAREVRSAEEILLKHLTYGENTYLAGQQENIIQAMQEYANQFK